MLSSFGLHESEIQGGATSGHLCLLWHSLRCCGWSGKGGEEGRGGPGGGVGGAEGEPGEGVVGVPGQSGERLA